jgi:hypothetical protein
MCSIYMSCYRTSNNKHFASPPRMADGRHFTDYRANYNLNNQIKTDNGVANSFEFKAFLCDNGNNIRELNKKHAFNKNGVKEFVAPYETGTMLPEKQKVKCDKNKCEIVDNYEHGIGMGRIYNTEKVSNCLKPLSGPEYPLDNNLCQPMESLANYYPLDNTNNNVQRVASPGGGAMLSGGDPNTYN